VPLPPELVDTYRSYWPLVQQSATTKAEDGGYAYTSADLVAAAAELERRAGGALTFAAGSQLTQLFSLARSNDRAASELLAARPDVTITGRMIGAWPTAAPAGVFDIQPEYMAKAQFTYINQIGEQSTGWITMTGLTHLPPSTGNLALRMRGIAESQYAMTPEEGGTPKTDAEVMAEFGEFTDLQLYAV